MTYVGTRLSRHYELFLYYNLHSYYSQRIYLALIFYNIKFTSQEIIFWENENLKSWFLRINKSATLPVLRHGNLILINTLSIVEYLESYFSNNELQLLPTNHFHKIKRIMELIDSLNMTQLKNYIILDSELHKKILIPETVLNKETSNFLHYDSILSEYSQQNQDLISVYNSFLERWKLLKNSLQIKKFVDDIYLKLEHILDIIEMELTNNAINEINRLEKKHNQSWRSQILNRCSSIIPKKSATKPFTPTKMENFSVFSKKSFSKPDYQPLLVELNKEGPQSYDAINYSNNNTLMNPHETIVRLTENQSGGRQILKEKLTKGGRDKATSHVTITIPSSKSMKGSIVESEIIPPMSKNGEGKIPLWICHTRDLSAADIWLIVLLNQLRVLGLSENYWNDRGLRPHINNYYKLVVNYLKSPMNVIFVMYPDGKTNRADSLVDHAHTRYFKRWVNRHFANPFLKCMGYPVPTKQHYCVFYWTIGVSITAIAATSIGLLYYFVYRPNRTL